MSEQLDSRRVRDEMLAELKPRVERMAALGRPPGLAVVLVGNDPASEIYVRNKAKACAALGILSEKHTPPECITTEELLSLVHSLNRRPDIDGILVQMPLPRHVHSRAVLLAIAPEKDVDGFHPFNVGQLVSGAPGPRACTPFGVMELLRRSGISPAGKRAVVVGRSDIVGKPMAMLLLHAHATVTICHSRTPDLPAECRRADILVAAVGRPAMLTAGYIGKDAIVIDVGINRLQSRDDVERIFRGDPEALAAFDAKGSLLVGDAHPLDVAEHAARYTPVPGGVGLLTVAALMHNTVQAAERRIMKGPA